MLLRKWEKNQLKDMLAADCIKINLWEINIIEAINT
jgi:hypothetical protein